MNWSSDPEQEYFADGITEDLTTELSRISGLFVISRHSAFVYKGVAKPAAEITAELGVRYLLGRSVRKAGTRLRISAQLKVFALCEGRKSARQRGFLLDEELRPHAGRIPSQLHRSKAAHPLP